jgi:hypothetical protein
MEVRDVTLLGRLFASRIVTSLFGGSVVRPLLTAIGLFTFLAGGFYLLTLEPTRMQLIMGILLLAVFALLCTAVGQLATAIDRLDVRDAKHVKRENAP